MKYLLNYKLSQLFLLLTMIISSILISFAIKEGHGWGGDFSLYVHQSKAIVNSSLNELYEWNKFSMQNSQNVLGPYLYPNGFPILLSPVYYFFGIDFMKMKVFCSIFFIFSLPLIFLLFKECFTSYIYPLIIVLSVAFSHHFITFTDNILSDLPFLFFCLLSIFLFNRQNSISNQILLGVSIFYAYFIRDIGISLIPALLVYQYINVRQYAEHRIYLIFPYLTFSFLIILSKQMFPYGAENHYQMILSSVDFSFNLYTANIQHYIKLISKYFFFNHGSILFGSIALVLSVVGLTYKWKKALHFTVFTISYILILIIWPSKQGLRFLFPILPFLTFFIMQGLFFIVSRLNQNRKYLYILLAIYLLVYFIESINSSFILRKKVSNKVFTIEMIDIYEYVANEIPTDYIVGFKKPRVLALFTGSRSVYTDLEMFDNSVADYLLIQKRGASSELLNKYSIHKEFSSYILIKKL